MFNNRLPLEKLTVIHYPTDVVNIRVEKHKAKLTDNGNPVEFNAWSYVPVSSAELASKPDPNSVLENYLGPVINVKRGKGLSVRWINTLGADADQSAEQENPPITVSPDDLQRLLAMWKNNNMNPTRGIVTHLHGGKVAQDFDGWPLWPVGFNNGDFPPNPNQLPIHRTYYYPNRQRATLLWFHDHAMDNTAPQVFAGLAGLYFIRDEGDAALFDLIGGEGQEIPLVIQDRYFDEAKQKFDYVKGLPATDSSSLPGSDRPEFLGDTIFVNGRPWPCHKVDRRIFRLRILNGSNARTYSLALWDADSNTWHTHQMQVIGTEGGLLAQPVRLDKHGFLTIAPGERRDVLLDLTGLDDKIKRLRVVNLAIAAIISDRAEDPEPIFRYHAPRKLDHDAATRKDQRYSLLQIDERTAANLADGRANIMELRLTDTDHAKPVHFHQRLAHILRSQANDDAFVWNDETSTLVPWSGTVERNRLVLLMNNTMDLLTTDTLGVEGFPKIEGWQDTQIWELTDATLASPKLPRWQLPFVVDLQNDLPDAPEDAQSQAINYAVARRTFLTMRMQADDMGMEAGDACKPPQPLYANLIESSIQAKQGTYERWYVANIGNGQPTLHVSETGKQGKDINRVPDMHPFHIHLVNFIVLRRWEFKESGRFELQQAGLFDKVARDDTVRIGSNELLELLVYYPPNYIGDYPYHCHLVEHEDMGMMLHFSVS
jgi:FtsP/CotA-like multicopper oxidase with cupredoxin domain